MEEMKLELYRAHTFSNVTMLKAAALHYLNIKIYMAHSAEWIDFHADFLLEQGLPYEDIVANVYEYLEREMKGARKITNKFVKYDRDSYQPGNGKNTVDSELFEQMIRSISVPVFNLSKLGMLEFVGKNSAEAYREFKRQVLKNTSSSATSPSATAGSSCWTTISLRTR